MNTTPSPLSAILLNREAYRLAEKFAAQQATPEKQKRVYLNTLAVYAVHRYLKLLQIETNLEKSDSWHPVKRSLFDVADLVLPGIGKIECCPVLPGETTFNLPLEATDSRLGYVAVHFDEKFSQVSLIGFARCKDAENPPEQIQISQLQPLDGLIDCIYEVLEAIAPVPVQSAVVDLSKWHNNFFDKGWQILKESLSTALADNHDKLAWNLRSVMREPRSNSPEKIVKGIKIIDLGIQLANHPVALVVILNPSAKYNLALQLYPTSSNTLPEHTRLTVLDKSGAKFLEAQARSADNLMELLFHGDRGDSFSVEVALGAAIIRENFLV